jgi:hypothetical protein
MLENNAVLKANDFDSIRFEEAAALMVECDGHT